MTTGMTKLTRHSASAALEMRPDGVLVVRLAGPLTGDTLQHFKAQIVALHGSEVRAFVADYTRGVVALSGSDLDAVLDGEEPDNGPGLPAGMVVTQDQQRLFLEHALRMASRGVLRQVFTSLPQALGWAQRHAERSRT